ESIDLVGRGAGHADQLAQVLEPVARLAVLDLVQLAVGELVDQPGPVAGSEDLAHLDLPPLRQLDRVVDEDDLQQVEEKHLEDGNELLKGKRQKVSGRIPLAQSDQILFADECAGT